MTTSLWNVTLKLTWAPGRHWMNVVPPLMLEHVPGPHDTAVIASVKPAVSPDARAVMSIAEKFARSVIALTIALERPVPLAFTRSTYGEPDEPSEPDAMPS